MINIIIGLTFILSLVGISYLTGIAMIMIDDNKSFKEAVKNDTNEELIGIGFCCILVFLIVLVILWILGSLIRILM